METGGTAAGWDDVLREHDAPAPRRFLALRLVGALAWLLLAVVFIAERNWPSALFSAPLAVATLLNRRRRRQTSLSTAVSGDGLHVRGLDRDRYLTWDQVLEVYPRTPWGTWPTVRTRDGSTVALPGVDDCAAARVEQFAAHLGVGR